MTDSQLSVDTGFGGSSCDSSLVGTNGQKTAQMRGTAIMKKRYTAPFIMVVGFQVIESRTPQRNQKLVSYL